MAWNRNAEKVISAALAVERVRGQRPWTAADLIAYLDEADGADKPSDATVYRLLNRFDKQLGLLASVTDETDDAKSLGRPRRTYELTPEGAEAAASAANWLAHGGIPWASVIVADP